MWALEESGVRTSPSTELPLGAGVVRRAGSKAYRVSSTICRPARPRRTCAVGWAVRAGLSQVNGATGGGERSRVSLEGHEARRMFCRRCQRAFDPRVNRYGFLLLQFRGHDRGPFPVGVRDLLCGPCATELLEDLEHFLEGAELDGLRRGVIHCGRSIRDGG